LEGTFKGHLVQPPCNEQGHLQLDHVAHSPIQPDLECFHNFYPSFLHKKTNKQQTDNRSVSRKLKYLPLMKKP